MSDKVDLEASTLIDRQAIVDVTIEYCWTLDEHAWERLALVFTPDAVAVLGRECRGLGEIEERVREALEPLDSSQHSVTNHQVTIDGDRATCRCYFRAQHLRSELTDGPLLMVGGRYEDELVRAANGWRITKRTLVSMWTDGNPAVLGLT